MKKVSMEDIAKIHNVSKVTVSKALNDKPGVSDELRQKIKATAKAKGYRLNSSARSLKTRMVYNIGVLIAERFIKDTASYYFGVWGQLTKKLSKLGYSAIMETLTYENEKNLALPIMYTERKVDGLIILGQLRRQYLKLFESFDIPVVFFDFYVKDSNIDSVVIDNFYSGYQLTNLLIKKGHTHIGFVGNIYSTSSIQDRFLGYYRSLLEHKIPLNFAYVISDRNEDGQLIDLQLPEKMPTAFVCNNDQVAYYFINKLKEHGVRVPEDCSIVAFDNTIFSTISDPPITTVDTHVEELVEVVSKVIIKKINVPNKTYNRILVKASIIERESVRKVNGDPL
ncbi:MAG: substrate-binding domain-containing protein [Bacilli bacterium]